MGACAPHTVIGRPWSRTCWLSPICQIKSKLIQLRFPDSGVAREMGFFDRH